MSKTFKIAVVIMIALTAAACGENRYQTAGTIGGAAAGAAVGSMIGSGSGRTVAMIAGAAIGAYLGSQLGRYLDERDRELAQRNAKYAMENSRTGTTSTWENKNSGNRGAVTPTSEPFEQEVESETRTCRDFREEIELSDGRTEVVEGTRCQRADGSWEVVSTT